MNLKHWHDKAEKQWDEFAPVWNKNSEEMWETGSRKDIIPFFSEFVPEGSKVADIGCGDGIGTGKLAQAGYLATGIDLSSTMINLAKTNSSGISNVSFMQGDISSLPFQDSEMDAALVINSLEYTGEPLTALNEIRRVIKPGGHACFGILGPTAEPRKNFSYPRLLGKEVIINTILPWEFERLSGENGWELLAEHGVGKRGVRYEKLGHFSKELKQAVSFMWLFLLKKSA